MNLTTLTSPLDFEIVSPMKGEYMGLAISINYRRLMTFDYSYCCFEHKGITFVNSNN